MLKNDFIKNIPNILTILRILSLPVFLIFLINDAFTFAIIIFSFAAVTDILDGYSARILDCRTELGSYLDPIADKLLINSSLIVLYLSRMNQDHRLIPIWFIIIVLSRDIILIIGYFALYFIVGRVKIIPCREGKASSFFNVILIALILIIFGYDIILFLIPYLHFAIYILSGIVIISGIKYIWRGLIIFNAKKSNISDQSIS